MIPWHLLLSICKYIKYCKEERSLLYLVNEAAEEKADGASGVDVSSGMCKELKCRGILH
jgi:hypothetical protein